MGTGFSRKTTKAQSRTIFLNWRTFVVSILGALLFFKFFSSMAGIVTDKWIDSGWFHQTSYYLTLKTETGKAKKRRVRPEIYGHIEKNDRLKKNLFSFSYLLNGETISIVTPKRFIARVTLIYVFITGSLFFLERSRK